MYAQLLDPLPILGVFGIFAVVAIVAFESGFRVGHWWQARTPDEREGPTGMLVGSLLGLLAFLLAVTMGMASERFDTRRAVVLQEANSIGTTYLRAGFLPEPAATDVRILLREYAPLRVNRHEAEWQSNAKRAGQILDTIWARTEAIARADPGSHATALFVESLNETIDLLETRTTAVVYARVPETILLLLFVGQAAALAVVGYSAGLTGRRGLLSALVLVLVLGAVLTIVVDLDRPRDGFLRVSQQPLVDLVEQLQREPGDPIGDPGCCLRGD